MSADRLGVRAGSGGGGLEPPLCGEFQGGSGDRLERRPGAAALWGQLVADARVALQVAGRALQGYAKAAPETQELRTAQQLLQDLLAQDIDEEPEDGGDPQIRRGTAQDRIVSTTDPEMRHGRKSNTQRFDGHKATVVVDTDDQVVLATDVRAGNVADREGAAQLVAEAAARSGQELEEVLGDTAYGDLATRACD